MWASLGSSNFSADKDAVVTIRNAGTSGYVIADAVQFLAADEATSPKPADYMAAETLKLAQTTSRSS